MEKLVGTTLIIAALLHDVVEDTDITLEYKEEFGERAAKICDGLTKISGVLSPGSSIQSKTLGRCSNISR